MKWIKLNNDQELINCDHVFHIQMSSHGRREERSFVFFTSNDARFEYRYPSNLHKQMLEKLTTFLVDSYEHYCFFNLETIQDLKLTLNGLTNLKKQKKV